MPRCRIPIIQVSHWWGNATTKRDFFDKNVASLWCFTKISNLGFLSSGAAFVAG